MNISNGTSFGSTATYTCDTGYAISGSQSRSCGADGNWTTTEPACNGMPTCSQSIEYTVTYFVYTLVIDCGSIDNFQNGQVDLSNGTTFGSVATFTCNSGFILSHQQVVTCAIDGMWSPSIPTCNGEKTIGFLLTNNNYKHC